jgi:hypothetical protein
LPVTALILVSFSRGNLALTVLLFMLAAAGIKSSRRRLDASADAPHRNRGGGKHFFPERITTYKANIVLLMMATRKTATLALACYIQTDIFDESSALSGRLAGSPS